MIKLEFALLADAADIGRTGKVSMVGANIETVTAASLPATLLAFTVVAFFAIPESASGVEHRLKLAIDDPRGENLSPSDVVLRFTPQANPNGFPVRHMIVLNLAGLTVYAAGIHTLRFIVDDEEVGTAVFAVIHAPVIGEAEAPASKEEGQ